MRGPFSLSMAILLMAAPPVRAEEMKAGIEAGNVVLETGTQKLRLTSSGQDTEPVLTPDRKAVIFTRKGGPADEAVSDCRDRPPFDRLMRVGLDGKGEGVIVEGRGGATPPEDVPLTPSRPSG